MSTLYVVSVSDNPNIPIGTTVGLPTRVRVWIGATEKPNGSMGDLTAVRGDLVCDRCWTSDQSVKLAPHDCPNQPEPEPWTPHPDQIDMLEGLLP